jgi:hypothetical protein
MHREARERRPIASQVFPRSLPNRRAPNRGRHRLTSTSRGFLSLEAFGRRPPCSWHRLRWGVIRIRSHSRRFVRALATSAYPPTLTAKEDVVDRSLGHKRASKRALLRKEETNSREESYGKARLESRLVVPGFDGAVRRLVYLRKRSSYL